MSYPPGFEMVDFVDVQTLLGSRGGCPANNTKCVYLIAVCTCLVPILYTNGEKYICESAYFREVEESNHETKTDS
jgi:hypothetical protein